MAQHQIHPALREPRRKSRWLTALFTTIIVAPIAVAGGTIYGRNLEYKRINGMIGNICYGNQVKRHLDFTDRAMRTVAVPLDRIYPGQFIPDFATCGMKPLAAKKVRTYRVDSKLNMFR